MGMCFHLGGMLSRLKCRPSVYVVHTEDPEEEIMGIPEWLGLEMRFNETIKAGGGSFPHSEDRPTPEGYKMLKKYLEHEYKFLEVLENEMGDKSGCNQQPPSPPHPPTPPAVPAAPTSPPSPPSPPPAPPSDPRTIPFPPPAPHLSPGRHRWSPPPPGHHR